MTRKAYFIIVLSVFITTFSLLTANAQTGSKTQSLSDLELKLHNNKTANLSELKGKVILLDFWYRSCAYCVQAIPDLILLQEEFKEDLIIIGINDFDIQEDVIDYLDYKKMNYSSTYKTDNKISKIVDVKLFPTIILYDKQGNIIKMDAGYTKAKMRSLRRAIKRALK